MTSTSLQSIIYTRGSLQVLDQLKLPHETSYLTISNSEDAWSVIRTMQVRGAPLIAITAVLGLAVEALHKKFDFTNLDEAGNFLLQKIEYLRTSRPTAVNLFVATDELTQLLKQILLENTKNSQEVIQIYVDAAELIFNLDIDTNKAIGNFGANRILELVQKPRVRVLTICNTGSLATAGYGTALGVVRSLHEQGRLEHVYACETRPYNQGSRLTAFEIVHDHLPGTLIADSMASYLIGVKGVDVVVVGADRIAANGDTANKIGTFQLAIAAHYHNVPFFVAAPTTTLDLSIASGVEIHVEERPSIELTR
jgi:methylthioribose-1-phosphate isomerase